MLAARKRKKLPEVRGRKWTDNELKGKEESSLERKAKTNRYIGIPKLRVKYKGMKD